MKGGAAHLDLRSGWPSQADDRLWNLVRSPVRRARLRPRSTQAHKLTSMPACSHIPALKAYSSSTTQALSVPSKTFMIGCDN